MRALAMTCLDFIDNKTSRRRKSLFTFRARFSVMRSVMHYVPEKTIMSRIISVRMLRPRRRNVSEKTGSSISERPLGSCCHDGVVLSETRIEI